MVDSRTYSARMFVRHVTAIYVLLLSGKKLFELVRIVNCVVI